MNSKTPLFILGNPRSGTSLLRIMLTSHPRICVPPESGYIQWWSNKYGYWSKENSEREADVAGYISDLRTSKKIETWNLDYQNLKKLIMEERPASYAELSLLAIDQYARQQNKSVAIAGDKNNYYISHLELLKSIFPQGKFLGIIRDGRDVACSYKAMQDVKTESKYKPNLPFEISEIAKEWQSNNDRILNFLETLPEANAMVVRYEDLINDTINVLASICNFLDIGYSEEMLSYATKNKHHSLEPAELLAWKTKTLEEPDKNNIGKYKSELKQNEIESFERIATAMLERFHYI